MIESRNNIAGDPVPRHVRVAAWAVPAMVLGQFALLSAVPVTVVAVGAWRDPRLRYLRVPATALAAAVAAPIAAWASREDPASSLSKDIRPSSVVFIVLASAALLLKTRRGPKAGMIAPV